MLNITGVRPDWSSYTIDSKNQVLYLSLATEWLFIFARKQAGGL